MEKTDDVDCIIIDFNWKSCVVCFSMPGEDIQKSESWHTLAALQTLQSPSGVLHNFLVVGVQQLDMTTTKGSSAFPGYDTHITIAPTEWCIHARSVPVQRKARNQVDMN
jgi:hypothetical protein